jgi:RHS repeat-associated protein
MVALNKTYQKTLTPDRSAKDSGLRFYSPEISRWLNRDPVGEDGGLFALRCHAAQIAAAASQVGVTLYGFTANEPVRSADALGLQGLSFWLEQGATSIGLPEQSTPTYGEPELQTEVIGLTPWVWESLAEACIGIYDDGYVEHLDKCEPEEAGLRIYFYEAVSYRWAPAVYTDTQNNNIITRKIAQHELAMIHRFTAVCKCAPGWTGTDYWWYRKQFFPSYECLWNRRTRTKTLKQYSVYPGGWQPYG